MKRIVDSVHGNIYIEDKYFRFIDTVYFQRLRRIEQSSIRSIFPCARHDRFSHSIGVFYMGKRIANQLSSELDSSRYYEISENEVSAKKKYEIIVNSYLIACLLHDIAHAPFSHTFEKYYGTPKQLCETLNQYLDHKIQFSQKDYNRIKEHEIVSATLIAHKFKEIINEEPFHGDYELVVRMIIGQKYENADSNRDKQIRNCFISLLNGGIVDADRLDYASRDIWASGYKTATIDFERLISNIHLKKAQESDIYEVCFAVNVINEIRSLCEIKQFQAEHVFCHHTVLFEQYLFDKAAENMMYTVEERGEKGLQKIINYSTFSAPVPLSFRIKKRQKNNYNFYMVSDEDLLFLMKQIPDNEYYTNWSRRNYTMQTLWKTEDAFSYRFPHINKSYGPKNNNLITSIKEILKEYGFESEKECIVKPYGRKMISDVLPIYIITHNDEVVRYAKYIHSEEKEPSEDCFYYVYVDKKIWSEKSIEEKDEIKEAVGNKILEYCQNIIP